MAGARLVRFWRLRGGGDLTGGRRGRAGSPLDHRPAWPDPLAAWSAVVVPLALLGAFTLLASPKRHFLALPLLTIVLVSARAVVFGSSLRQRAPIEPLVVLHAAVGATQLWSRWGRRRARLELVPRA
jgi:hypothetical protein